MYLKITGLIRMYNSFQSSLSLQQRITLGILTKNRVVGLLSNRHFQNKYRLHSNHGLSLKYHDQSRKNDLEFISQHPSQLIQNIKSYYSMIVAIAQLIKLFAHIRQAPGSNPRRSKKLFFPHFLTKLDFFSIFYIERRPLGAIYRCSRSVSVCYYFFVAGVVVPVVGYIQK